MKHHPGDTEAALLRWYESESDVCDDLHRHFEAFGEWDWLDVSDEARRVFNLMFPGLYEQGPVEEFSPIDGVWTAAAAQAAHGAFAAVAAALGVDARALEAAVQPWYEAGPHNTAPPPISAQAFVALVQEEAAHRALSERDGSETLQ